MAFFPKTLVKWKEPQTFRKQLIDARQKRKPKWLSPVLVILFCAFIFLRIWFASLQNPAVLSPDKIAAIMSSILLLAIGLVYGVSFLEKILPSRITITTKSILRDNRPLVLKQVVSYGWLGGETHPIFQIRTVKGWTRIYGVPDLITQEKIDQAFLSCGISKENDLPNFRTVLESPAARHSYLPFICLLSWWLVCFSIFGFFAKALFEESKSIKAQTAAQELDWKRFEAEVHQLHLPKEKEKALLKLQLHEVYPSRKTLRLFIYAVPAFVFFNLATGTFLIFKFFEVKTLKENAAQARG